MVTISDFAWLNKPTETGSMSEEPERRSQKRNIY